MPDQYPGALSLEKSMTMLLAGQECQAQYTGDNKVNKTKVKGMIHTKQSHITGAREEREENRT